MISLRTDSALVSHARNHPFQRLLALVAGILLQGFAGWGLWWSHPWPAPVWLGAATAGALVYAWALAGWSAPDQAYTFVLYVVLCFFIPVYGAAGCAAIMVYLRRAHGGRLAAQLDDMDTPELSHRPISPPGLGLLTVDQMVRHELSVQPYTDIVRGADRRLKQALIRRILTEWTPNAVTLLKELVADPDYDIRSYASVALTSIENRMSARIQQLRREHRQNPGDASLALRLARSYLDYAGSGLLDAGSTRHYATTAEQILDRLEATGPLDDEVWMDVMTVRGQVARLQGDSETEDQVYRDILARYPEHQDTLGYYCNLLLHERRFPELRAAAARLQRHAVNDHPALEAARLWAEPVPRGGTS